MFNILRWLPCQNIKVSKGFKTWLNAKKGNNLYFPMVGNILGDFGSHEIKTLGGATF